jgi:hypothetical protein
MIALVAVLSASADEQDTLWFRIAGAGVQDLDFTPDDKYVIAWTNAIEFWEVEHGIKEYSIPIDAKAVGDYNYNNEYLVFAKDSTPKLLNWQTKEVVEGFEKAHEDLGRIRTAKSKNEFMANTFHHDETFGDKIGNVIYFYNIDSKSKVDSLVINKQFERNEEKWKITIDDYDYVGKNDEYIYVYMHETNNELGWVPQVLWQRIFYANFYDRATKELIDSVLVFHEYKDHYGIINKMQVMNDRSKIAWNNKGGEINFYDVYTQQFYDKLVFDSENQVQVGDIEFDKNSSVIGLTQGQGCCRYLKIFSLVTKEKLLQYNVGSWGQISISDNNDYLITSISNILSLYGNQWSGTGVEESGSHSLIITPNPVASAITISYNFDYPTEYEFSIYDLTGNKLHIVDSGLANNLDYKFNYDISYLSSGTYFIRLELNHKVYTQQFIKE